MTAIAPSTTTSKSAVRAPKIDTDLIAAIAWCRIGGRDLGRPQNDGAYHNAKVLGLLAQDPCWRATERGEGVLIATGMLEGKPAPEQATVHVLWARSPRYTRPQFVTAWSDGFVDMRHEEFAEQLSAAKQAWTMDCDTALSGGAWEFWTTVEYLDTHEPPENDRG